jgi:hypothetical protein
MGSSSSRVTQQNCSKPGWDDRQETTGPVQQLEEHAPEMHQRSFAGLQVLRWCESGGHCLREVGNMRWETRKAAGLQRLRKKLRAKYGENYGSKHHN